MVSGSGVAGLYRSSAETSGVSATVPTVIWSPFVDPPGDNGASTGVARYRVYRDSVLHKVLPARYYPEDHCVCALREDAAGRPIGWNPAVNCSDDYFVGDYYASCRALLDSGNYWIEAPRGGGDPNMGIGYHPGVNGAGEAIYTSVFNGYASWEARAHGTMSLDLQRATGAWYIGGQPGNVQHIPPVPTDKFVFAAPQEWANSCTKGRSLIVGQGYQSGLGVPSHGPSLYAIAPWSQARGTNISDMPSDRSVIPATELLRYGDDAQPDHWMTGWDLGQGYSGGARLQVGQQSAVVIAVSDPRGDSWYGHDDGTLPMTTDLDLPSTAFRPSIAGHTQRGVQHRSSSTTSTTSRRLPQVTARIGLPVRT